MKTVVLYFFIFLSPLNYILIGIFKAVCHKLIKKIDRQRKVVFSKVATFFADLFWIAALSFLPKGMGGVFVDYSGYNKKYREFVY